MTNSIPNQLRFASSAGFTLRADFDGGVLSSDLGSLLLRGVDQQIGLTDRLSNSAVEKPNSDHPVQLRQDFFEWNFNFHFLSHFKSKYVSHRVIRTEAT
jgi:hypothetical protein